MDTFMSQMHSWSVSILPFFLKARWKHSSYSDHNHIFSETIIIYESDSVYSNYAKMDMENEQMKQT